MYCYQCEETLNNSACTNNGICGKTSTVSDLQDQLIYVLKVIAAKGEKSEATDKFIMEGLFSTVTNVNFSADFFTAKIEEAKKIIGESVSDIEDKSGILTETNEDLRSLKELLMYGIKGVSAYLDHAYVLGYKDQEIFDFIREGLSAMLEDKSADELTALVLKCGSVGVKAMALLDKANTEKYGNPSPTKVNLGVRSNPGILISGHDLKDMKELLEQTKGTGVDVYTHGEMLPAHAYPEFSKYEHLVGNYGGSWWRQAEEFEAFNGVILMTTNCIVPPRDSYKDKIYTTGLAGYDGVKHVKNDNGDMAKDFSVIIEHAKKCDPPKEIESGAIDIGFAHKSILDNAEKIIEAVNSGALKRFVVMAGCDGRMNKREYYTDFAKALPQDTIILTAGCAKFRYNKLKLGDIVGIPRVIDAGQCNDSYSLVVVAQKLAEAFGVDDINKLPISYNIAWYEQKAVIVLLALLSLGVKNIKLGPRLPAFVSPNVLKVLVEKFSISGISDVEADMKVLIP